MNYPFGHSFSNSTSLQIITDIQKFRKFLIRINPNIKGSLQQKFLYHQIVLEAPYNKTFFLAFRHQKEYIPSCNMRSELTFSDIKISAEDSL